MCQTLCHDHFPWVPSTLPAKAWRQIATLPLERWNTESSEVKALSDHRTVSLEQAVFKTRCDSKINHEQVKHENTKQASFSKHSLREEKKQTDNSFLYTALHQQKPGTGIFPLKRAQDASHASYSLHTQGRGSMHLWKKNQNENQYCWESSLTQNQQVTEEAWFTHISA